MTNQATDKIAIVRLAQGLDAEAVHQSILAAAREGDVSLRALAFHLADLADRGLFKAKGYCDVVAYGRGVLDFERTKTLELVRAGRALEELPQIDAAFAAGCISWSRVRELARVATTATQAEWLEEAQRLGWEKFRQKAATAAKGQRPGRGKGTPTPKLTFRTRLSLLDHELVTEAMAKLSAWQGAKLTPAQALTEMARLLLAMNADGSVPGLQPANNKLFTIVLHRREGGLPALHTDSGEVEIDGAAIAAIAADANVVDLRAQFAACSCSIGDRCQRQDCDLRMPAGEVDVETPAALRDAVLLRDGKRCLICGSRDELMAHHGEHRSDGGRTLLDNLLSVCSLCHGLIHAELITVRGRPSRGLQFLDAQGSELGRHVTGVLPVLEIEPRTAARPVPPAEPLVSPDLRLADLIGQERARTLLANAAAAALLRQAPVDHVLLSGPSGLGKTTLALALAAELGVPARVLQAPMLREPEQVASLLEELSPGEIVFIDELHSLGAKAAEMLYTAMDENRFTLVGATTDPELLARPFLSRFTLKVTLEPYSQSELSAVIARRFERDALSIEFEAAHQLAAASRGTPREALALAARMRDDAILHDTAVITAAAVERTLRAHGIDARGLDTVDRRILEALASVGRPLGAYSLAAKAGISERALLDRHEPWLLRQGLIEITPRGRILAG